MPTLSQVRRQLKLPFADISQRSSTFRRVLPAVFFGLVSALALGVILAATPALPTQADNHTGGPEPMMQSVSASWDMSVLFNIGARVGGPEGYRPAGLLDGMGALSTDEGKMLVLANHELRAGYGETYTLASGAELRGARVSRFTVNPDTLAVEEAGLAYDTIIDRYGKAITPQMAAAAADAGEPLDLQRLCSAYLGRAGEYGLVDDIFFTGEETGGGQLFALDVAGQSLHAVPAAGRAAFESVALVDSGSPNKVAMLIGDDREGAPLLLYVGTKDTSRNAGFLERNGLANGKLYVWRARGGHSSPEDWNGTNATASGRFVEINYHRSGSAGNSGYDANGYADQDTQDAMSDRANHFEFSRPEDISTNPENPGQVIFASTGRGGAYPSDNWGTTYIVNVDIPDLTADLSILYDGDDAGNGQFPGGSDYGLRSPDNLVWANDGYAYIQEDRSVANRPDFGGASGREASLWQINPEHAQLSRIGEIDRAARLPIGAYDTDPDDLGDWESSGVIDVSEFFPDAAGTTLLLNVQAHSVKGDLYGGDNVNQGLVEGGQLLLLQQTR